MKVSIIAYGCRNGTHPEGLDLIYDCRAIRNPHHKKELRALTGFDSAVQDEVLITAAARALLRQIKREVLERFALTHEVKVGVYCTGGRHRSVVIALAALQMFLHDLPGLTVELTLRDRARWIEYGDGLDSTPGEHPRQDPREAHTRRPRGNPDRNTPDGDHGPRRAPEC
jgi:RNase adaptor protein for sRNA GlmZ degradation